MIQSCPDKIVICDFASLTLTFSAFPPGLSEWTTSRRNDPGRTGVLQTTLTLTLTPNSPSLSPSLSPSPSLNFFLLPYFLSVLSVANHTHTLTQFLLLPYTLPARPVRMDYVQAERSGRTGVFSVLQHTHTHSPSPSPSPSPNLCITIRWLPVSATAILPLAMLR